MEEEIEQIVRWIDDHEEDGCFYRGRSEYRIGNPGFPKPGRDCGIDITLKTFISRTSSPVEASRVKYWQMATEMYEPMKQAQPNLAHLAIAEMERLGKLDCVITQNIDGLHFKAGNSPEKVIEIHGTAMHVSCLHCQKRYNRDDNSGENQGRGEGPHL